MKSQLITATSQDLMAVFQENVQATPNKIAIVSADNKSTTYAELDKITNRLANHLKEFYQTKFTGATKPLMIGVNCKEKINFLCAELAILKLGATIVPLNCNDPEERQQFIIKKAETVFIIDDSNLAQLKDYENAADVVAEPQDSDLAYVLFTSGSTAKNPKGVLQTRGNLLRQMQHYSDDLMVTKADCFLNLAPLTHDQAIVDCFAALLNGCTLCLYDTQNLKPAMLFEFMKKNQVTIYSSIPSLFATIFEEVKDPNLLPDLRIVTIGGEETRIAHAALYQKTCPPQCLLVNGYGATEISWISSYTIDHNTDLTLLTAIPIGFATESAEIKLVLDSDTNMYELCIASDCLSPGYLKDEEANKKAFFKDESGKQFYRTGDLVSLDEQNCIHFKGRQTWHEKIRGKRFNLHEVEDGLEKSQCGDEAVVVTFGEDAHKKIYAFYSGEIMDYQTINSKLKLLRKFIPGEILPTKFYHLDTIPKLTNGKINRPALKEKIAELVNISAEDRENFTKLQQSSTLEQVMEGYWRDVLDIPSDTALDDSSFQELGGNSHLAIILANKINYYLKNTEGLPEFADSVHLYDSQRNNFKSFYQHVQEEVNKAKRQKLCGEYVLYLPKMTEKSTTRFEEFKVVEYNEEALKILIEYYNNRYGINIRFGASYQAILDIIANSDKDFESFSQIGLWILAHDSPNSHPHAAVLCKDKETGEKILFVNEPMDDIQNMAVLTQKDGVLRKIQIQFPEIEIRFDSSARQVESNSCSTIALLYLKEALQVDMLKDSIMIYDKSHEAYENLLCGGDSTGTFKKCVAFISPTETYKFSQRTIPKEVDQNSLLKTGKNNETLASYLSRHSTQEIYFRGSKVNTVCWDKSFKFVTIVKDKVEKDILPRLYHFIISLNQKKHDLYLKKSLFTDTFTLKALEDFLQLYFDIPDRTLNLVTEYEILSSMSQLENYFQDNPAGIELRIIDKKTVDQEENAAKILHQSFKVLYRQNLDKKTDLVFFSHDNSGRKSFQPTTIKDIFVAALAEDPIVLSTLQELGWVDKDCNLLNQNLYLQLGRAEALKESQGFSEGPAPSLGA